MRMMVRIQVPAETGNRAVKDGTLASIFEKAQAQLKPEATYFTTFEGDRTAFLVLDMKGVEEMPFVAERFFLGLGAKVDFSPAMTPEQLHAGFSGLS